jgi:ribosomal protein L11 methyltransferase
VAAGSRIADIGCGSGILAIAAARLGAAQVVAFEFESWSCAASRENAERNEVSHIVDVREGRVDPATLVAGPTFDGIVANIESGVLRPLLDAFRGAVSSEGWIVLSGILAEEWAAMEIEIDRAGLWVEEVDREGEWVSAGLRVGPTS